MVRQFFVSRKQLKRLVVEGHSKKIRERAKDELERRRQLLYLKRLKGKNKKKVI